MITFSKVDKKVLVVSVVAVIVILLIGFAIYYYVINSANPIQNLTNGAQTEGKSDDTDKPAVTAPQGQIQTEEVQTQGNSGVGTFTVCVDKCGDGICQKDNLICEDSGDLNCECPETSQDCPQDCK